MEGTRVRCLGPDEQEPYLGVPIGAKLRFHLPDDFKLKLGKISGSLLAPFQKMEAIRSFLLPSLSHHLAPGRVLKKGLDELDSACRKVLVRTLNLNHTAAKPFFYADRSVGGLGMCRLSDDADIWIIARAAQLLSSGDPVVRAISREQLCATVRRGMGFTEADTPLPLARYLSGDSDGDLALLPYGHNPTSTLWSLARHASARKKVQFQLDLSSATPVKLRADEIAVLPLKAVRGLRTVLRSRHTASFL